eukprot:1944245-Pyramimonas_sp.AAC.2
MGVVMTCPLVAPGSDARAPMPAASVVGVRGAAAGGAGCSGEGTASSSRQSASSSAPMRAVSADAATSTRRAVCLAALSAGVSAAA